MGFLQSVKKAATKTKLQSQLVLMDRELAAVKSRLGGELYPVLFQWVHCFPEQPFFAPHPILSAIYQAASEDISELQASKQQLDQELDQTLDDESQKWIASTSTATKLRAKLVYYEREIAQRKEIFGIQVFEELDLMSSPSSGKNDKDSLDDDIIVGGNRGGGESPSQGDDDEVIHGDSAAGKRVTDQDVLAVLDRCRASVQDILRRKAAKQEEIASLLIGTTTTTTTSVTTTPIKTVDTPSAAAADLPAPVLQLHVIDDSVDSDLI